MAVWIEGKGWVCNQMTRKGTPCPKEVVQRPDRPPEQWTCDKHNGLTGIVVQNGGEPTIPVSEVRQIWKVGYDGLLPERIKVLYNENTPELTSLRRHIALLEAFLRDKLSKIDKEGSEVLWSQARTLVGKLEAFSHPPDVVVILKQLADVIKRADNEGLLERDIRNLVKEISDTIKSDTQQVTALGTMFSLQQVVIMNERLFKLATKYIDDVEKRELLAQQWREAISVDTVE